MKSQDLKSRSGRLATNQSYHSPANARACCGVSAIPSPVRSARMAPIRRVNLILPFSEQALGFGHARVGGGKELRLKPLSMPSTIFTPYIIGEALAGDEVARCVLT